MCAVVPLPPHRKVLGIIGQDGALAQWLVLPISNLRVVPDSLTDLEAAFTEPLAAACRIWEQKLVSGRQAIAVIGAREDGAIA